MEEWLKEKLLLSEKQSAFVVYLLKRLGFKEEEFTYNFVRELSSISNIYSYNRATKHISDDQQRYYSYDGEYYVPDFYSIVDFLIDEYSFKKNDKSAYVAKTNSSFISATDLANYVFCPAGYSLSKTYIPKKMY